DEGSISRDFRPKRQSSAKLFDELAYVQAHELGWPPASNVEVRLISAPKVADGRAGCRGDVGCRLGQAERISRAVAGEHVEPYRHILNGSGDRPFKNERRVGSAERRGAPKRAPGRMRLCNRRRHTTLRESGLSPRRSAKPKCANGHKNRGGK